MNSPCLHLLPGREKSLLRHHPWIFSGAVAGISGNPAPGDTVEVRDARHRLLAHAAFSPASQIVGRVWSFDSETVIDRAFFADRIHEALQLRRAVGLDVPEGGCRLIASEADGLPGLIADRYGEFVVLQILSAGAERHRQLLAELLQEATGCRGVYERSDVSVRAREQLPERTGVLLGEAPPDTIEIRENGLRLLVDVRHGHKTGFYLDQRAGRMAIGQTAAGKTVLNCFAYTGAFAAAALAGGARHVVNVDSSGPALALAAENCRLNGFGPDRCENRRQDVFEALRECRDAQQRFDLVILDPPKFVDSKAALPRGCRAYQDTARLGFQLLNPGGMLATFSCSGLMTPELFQKITADAAIEAGVNGCIVRRLEQAADHPTALAVPESFYLKGLLVRI